MNKPFNYFLSVALILLILINFLTMIEEDAMGLKSGLLPDNLTDIPGEQFMPLRPYLKDVHVAGYYTDYILKDPEFDYPYQFVFEQAKSALAPTILDRFHPGSHQYMIVYLYYPRSLAQVLSWHEQIIARIDRHIILVKRY